jgi:hypothetical protein
VAVLGEETLYRYRRGTLRFAVIAIVVAVVAPISWAWADDRFVDVPPSNGHYNNINAIAEAGITLGCSDTSHYCPSDLVRRDQMASFLARLGGLGNNSRVANGRGQTSAYCAAVAARPQSFDNGPCTVRTRTLMSDSTQELGKRNAMTIDPEGLPVIVFLANDFAGDGSARLVRCRDASCRAFDTKGLYPPAIDYASVTPGSVGVGIGGDGNVVFTYVNVDIGLFVGHCDDPDCVNITNSPLENGSSPSIAIGRNGLPVLAYQRAEGLKIVRCTNAACTATNTPLLLDGAPSVGEYNSVAVDAADIPVVSYYDRANGALKVVRCANPACSAAETPSTVASGHNVGSHSALAIGVDGIPVIAHYDFSFNSLLLSRCTTAACIAAHPAITLAQGGAPGRFNSIAIREDGVAVVSTFDATTHDLRIARCTTPSCTAAVSSYVDTEGGVGEGSSLAMGVDGIPVIAYHDSGNQALKFARVPTY